MQLQILIPLPLQFAKQFQQRGNQVIATVRQQGASKQLQDALGGDVTVMQLDVADPKSVAAFADTARGVVDHVDVLINNAGAITCAVSARQVPMDLLLFCAKRTCTVDPGGSPGNGRGNSVFGPAAVGCQELAPCRLVHLLPTGILIYSDFQSVSADDMLDCFRINALGPLLTSQALLNAGLLGGGRRSIVGNVTSKVAHCFPACAALVTASLGG